MNSEVGIGGYGAFVPQYRIKTEEIWNTWCHRHRPASIERLLGVKEKAINSWHEDVITMASDAAKAALEMAAVPLEAVEAFYLGSGTHPYVTRGSMPLVAESLGLGPDLMGADCQFAGKSGTSALQACLGLVAGGLASVALAVGTDALSSHVAPNDWPLEYTAGAGAAAIILARDGGLAEVESTYSYATETADFFRLDGDRYIKRGVSPEEEAIGYHNHLLEATGRFLARLGAKPQDFQYLAIQQPSVVAPLEVARALGFRKEQVMPGLLADRIGDGGAASALLALAAILDGARPGERILLASYGYGAGSDLFSLRVTDNIEAARQRRRVWEPLKNQLDKKVYVDYTTYIRMERKLVQEYL